ncbi:hypothetical protein GM3709_1475 [Geminocystis sp. NIES-3709]|nr:hypothetical protein GM3709_1475 [Geminocystis sp. NIES-3709]
MIKNISTGSEDFNLLTMIDYIDDNTLIFREYFAHKITLFLLLKVNLS